MANRWENNGNSDRLFSWDTKITVDGECSHEIKGCLLLVRKAMTNLDSVLKSRDLTLPTKIYLVKAMVFLVVMYRCESLSRRSNQSILKEVNLEYSLEELILKLKLRYFGYLMRRTDSFEKTLMLGKIEGRRRWGQQRMRWLDGITDGRESE